MAFTGRVSSCHGENHPDPKSCQEVDPEKPGCTTSCQGDETDPTYMHVFFWILVSNSQLLQHFTFQTNYVKILSDNIMKKRA